MQLHHLVYVSSAKKQISTSEIDAILETSRKNNSKNNLTGILLFRSGLFLQLLEGEESAIRQIYKKILIDERHHNLICLVDQKAHSDRLFSGWSMGYREVTDVDVKMVSEILSWSKLMTAAKTIDGHIIMHMIDRFRTKAS